MYKKARFGVFMLVSVLVIFSMLLSACAKAEEATEVVEEPAAEEAAEAQPEAATPTKLVVASFYPLDQVSGWDGMVEKFKAAHPGVEIEVQVTGWNEYMPKLLSQIAAGDPPDVAGVENSPFPAFVEKNMLTDLTPYMERTSGFNPKDFFPHLLDRYTYDGKVYGIPYDAQPYAMLFFNPGLFDAAGVAYPTADTTWPELVELAKKLTVTDADGAITQYGIVGANEARAFLYAWNARYVDDLRNPTKCMLDTPEAQKGLQFMVDMMYTDKVTLTPAIQESLGGSSMVDLFVSGKSAMLFGGFWNAVENPEGFAAINAKLVMGPTGPDGNRVYATGGTAYTVMNGSKNPDLAWEFIQYFMGKVGTEEAFKSAKGGAIYPPGNIEAFDWYMQQPVDFVDTIQADKDALGYIIFAPYNLEWNEINDKCINPTMDLITRNTLAVEEGTQTMCTCVNDMLK